MAGDYNTIIKKYIGQEAWIIHNKCYVKIISNIEKLEGYYKFTNQGQDFNINSNNVYGIEYDTNSKRYKISYNSPAISKGVLKEINSKILTITISNKQSKKTYDVLIPMANIQGIKMTEEDE